MEEANWIARAAAGDQEAFARLVERYHKPVYHQALRLLSHPEDAADVTQEVFWKAWRALPSFRGESRFSTWLYRLTDHAAIDFLRREGKRRGDSSLDDEERENAVSQMPHPGPTPQEALEANQRSQALEEGLAALSQEHRRVLVLRELNGLSYQEIGDILSLSPGTVKSRIARARLALAKILQESGNFS